MRPVVNQFRDSALLFQERESLAEKLPVLAGATIGGSVPLYVDTDDAEGLYADLDAAGVAVVKSPRPATRRRLSGRLSGRDAEVRI